MTEQTYKTDANVARAEFSSLVNTVQARFARVSIDKIHLADRDTRTYSDLYQLRSCWIRQPYFYTIDAFGAQQHITCCSACSLPWLSSGWRSAQPSRSATTLQVICRSYPSLQVTSTCNGTCMELPLLQSVPGSLQGCRAKYMKAMAS